MKILMTGATGLIGKELGKRLVQKGHSLVVVSRDKNKALLHVPFPCEIIEADLNKQTLPDVGQIAAVVHLAGENISEARWSEAQKNKIIESRTLTSENLVKSFAGSRQLKVCVGASAIGIYGDRGDEVLNEKSAAGQGFLPEVCQKWEAAFNKFKVRQVQLRLGVVLSQKGGAFIKMSEPFSMGVGGSIGSGKQWMSWIHLEDLVEIFVEALEDDNLKGIYNAVAPEPTQNLKLTELLNKYFRPLIKMPVPKFALKMAMGQMSQIVTDSQRVVSEHKFKFKYPSIEKALENICWYLTGDDQLLWVEQYLPYPLEKVFEFFAEAKNLEKITPTFLNFKISKVSTQEVGAGTLIDYNLKIHGFPVKWKTEITDWEVNKQFADVQLSGPYKKWFHTHKFESLGAGTLMTDIIRYQLPMGRLGLLAAGSFVEKDVHSIFDFRRASVGKYI